MNNLFQTQTIINQKPINKFQPDILKAAYQQLKDSFKIQKIKSTIPLTPANKLTLRFEDFSLEFNTQLSGRFHEQSLRIVIHLKFTHTYQNEPKMYEKFEKKWKPVSDYFKFIATQHHLPLVSFVIYPYYSINKKTDKLYLDTLLRDFLQAQGFLTVEQKKNKYNRSPIHCYYFTNAFPMKEKTKMVNRLFLVSKRLQKKYLLKQKGESFELLDQQMRIRDSGTTRLKQGYKVQFYIDCYHGQFFVFPKDDALLIFTLPELHSEEQIFVDEEELFETKKVISPDNSIMMVVHEFIQIITEENELKNLMQPSLRNLHKKLNGRLLPDRLAVFDQLILSLYSHKEIEENILAEEVRFNAFVYTEIKWFRIFDYYFVFCANTDDMFFYTKSSVELKEKLEALSKDGFEKRLAKSLLEIQ